ncbi:hypothetical protein ABIC75_004596 [Dyella japonica]|uniref:Uncharacterized protein n=1 Tax=Dyella japonica TaxID=231455 RepID=A0ABV2K460_9GAMM
MYLKNDCGRSDMPPPNILDQPVMSLAKAVFRPTQLLIVSAAGAVDLTGAVCFGWKVGVVCFTWLVACRDVARPLAKPRQKSPRPPERSQRMAPSSRRFRLCRR